MREWELALETGYYDDDGDDDDDHDDLTRLCRRLGLLMR